MEAIEIINAVNAVSVEPVVKEKKQHKPRPTDNIQIVVQNEGKIETTIEAKSVCEMWKLLKNAWADFPNGTAFITKNDQPFMRLHLVKKSNGKYWQINDIPGTRRKASANKNKEN